MTDQAKKDKMVVLERIQEYMLKLETAKQYAEHALEHAIDEQWETAEWYMQLAGSVGDDTQKPAVKAPDKTEQLN